jgi:hypothetical protein
MTAPFAAPDRRFPSVSRFGVRGLHFSDNPPGYGSAVTPAPSGDGNAAPPGPEEPTPAPTNGDTPPPDETKLFTQADLNRIVQERLADQRKRAEKQIEDEKRAANEARLKEQGEFKTIAEQKEAELAELRPKAEIADQLAARMNAAIDAEVQAWPKEVTDMDPGAADVSARLAWQEKARPLAQRLLALGGGTTGLGGGSAAPPLKGGELTEAQRRAHDQKFAQQF